ncbi:MAG: hypothetical protein J6C33_00725 [Lachnospiraceae bacterium]|nr:hypothetical protein [Lachnospiraceae bacterium]
MDEKERDNVAVFDTLFTNNQIQIMKVLLPCFDRPMQKYLAIYIKYQELQYTLSYFKNHPYHICSASEDSKTQLRTILPALLPYCNDSQKQIVKQLEQVFSSLETYQEMMDMMELMKDMGLSQTDGSENASEDRTGETREADAPDGQTCEAREADAPDDAAGFSSSDMTDMLLSMLSPQQQGIFDLIKGGMKHE